MDHNHNQNLDTSLFRVLWPPHHHANQQTEAKLARALLASNQHEAEINEAAADRGERTWEQRN